MLTPKQEKFVQNIVKGMSQVDAYRDAYNTKSMSDNAVYREASLLMKNPKITQRHKELGAKTESNTIMTAQERLEYLTKVISGETGEKILQEVDGEMVEVDVPTSLKNKLSAIDIMNKMQGEYITKIEGEIKVNRLEDLL